MLGGYIRVRRERMKHLYIVRHGQTEWNAVQRMQGRLDSPLTEDGRQHAFQNGTLIKELGGVEQLCVSPAGRAMETAFIMNSLTQCNIEYFDELQERDSGVWSGMTVSEIAAQFPQAWATREDDPYNFRPPNGENLQDMLVRVHEILDALYASDFESVALVTHGVMSKVILKFYLDLNEVETGRLRHPNDLVYRLTFGAQEIETEHYIAGGPGQKGLLYNDLGPVVRTQSE
ncbi:MAG: broad specificity phosphatase PhoE [Limisphaerales bacterium]|jgi:broad specificity phosphatase PhoE